MKISTIVSRNFKPVYDDLTEEWIVPLNDKTVATISGLSATKATAYKLYEAWHNFTEEQQ